MVFFVLITNYVKKKNVSVLSKARKYLPTQNKFVLDSLMFACLNKTSGKSKLKHR